MCPWQLAWLGSLKKLQKTTKSNCDLSNMDQGSNGWTQAGLSRFNFGRPPQKIKVDKVIWPPERDSSVDPDDEGVTLERLALWSLYGDQMNLYALSTLLIKPNFLFKR